MSRSAASRGEFGPRVAAERHRSFLSRLATLLCLLALAAPAQAQLLYRRVGLAELSQRAGIIVQGQVIEARYEGHPDYPHVPTVVVTLQVERMLRGPAGERLSFRQHLFGLQGRTGKRRGYVPGQRLLIFLPEPSRYGLSSPLGGEQGRFRIQRDQQGNDLAENDLGNAGLFKDLAPQAEQAGVSLSPEQARLAEVKRGPVPLETLVSLVRQFASVARTE